MMSELDLKAAERKTYLSYFDDGITDIAAGLPVLSFGLGMVFDSSTLFMLSWLPVFLFWSLKRVITFPRIGYVKFSPQRQRRISLNMILMTVAGTVSLLLGVAAYLGAEGVVFDSGAFIMKYALLLFGAVMAGAFALIAVLFEVRRFFGYAALVFAGWLSTYVLDVDPGIPVAGAGGVVLLMGLALLTGFLVKYPVPSE